MKQHLLPGFSELEPPANTEDHPLEAETPEEHPFNWFGDQEDIVVESQPAIAVYRNRRGHVVIRAEEPGGDEDSFVIVSSAPALKAIIEKLQAELREGF